MYALIVNGAVAKYPYSIAQLRADHPDTSFPASTPELVLAEFGVRPVQESPQPGFNPDTHRLEEASPVESAGVLVQSWRLVELTAEERAKLQADKAERTRRQRQRAYQEESDPLFFKVQRGEVSMSEWMAKVNEIKARYP